MDDQPLPFPEIALAGPKAPLPADFVTLSHAGADPLWDFHLSLPGPAKARFASTEAPAPGASFHLLAAFRSEAEPLSLEVVGAYLEREADPEPRLRRWAQGTMFHEHVASRSFPLRSGKAGETLAIYTFGEKRYARRMLARKWGPRLLLAVADAPIDRYPQMASRVAQTLASLAIEHDVMGAYAEATQPVRGGAPVPWKTALPASWKILEAPEARGGAGFRATPTAPDVSGAPILDFTVLPRALAKNATEAAAAALTALSGELHVRHLTPAPSKEPFVAWAGSSVVLFGGWRCLLSCRVLLHNNAWIVVSGLGRDGTLGEEARGLCHRGVDVAAESLTIEA